MADDGLQGSPDILFKVARRKLFPSFVEKVSYDLSSWVFRNACVSVFLLVACPVSWSQDLYITEFMAVRSVAVVDDDGDDNDFIEIFNNGASTEPLRGYFLSDDCANPLKWAFPDGVEIDPGEFLVVWATEKDRTNPNAPLHTNFRLNGDGECVLLSDAAGELIHGYSPYPNQQLGYTYGLEMRGSTISIGPGSACKYRVPTSTNPPAGLGWTEPGFDDSGWTSGRSGVGYDTNPDYHEMISTDVEAAMWNIGASCYIRIPFQVDDPSAFASFDFSMRYDDGFIAYINGVRVTSRKAPDPGRWNSVSTTFQIDANAFNYETAAFDEGTPTLVAGENILAIHGVNETLGSSDFLADPRLESFSVGGTLQAGVTGYFSTPTPGGANVSGLPGIAERPVYSDPSGAYPPGLDVTLSMEVDVPGTEIRYTLNSTVPTEASTLYTRPVSVDQFQEVVMVARAFQPGLQPSKPIYRHYLILGSDVEDFNSTIPLVVISTLRGKRIPSPSPSTCGLGDYTDGRFLAVNPGDDGRAWLVDPVDFEHAAGYRRRGNPDFSCGRTKFFFNVEFRDREGKDDDEIPFAGFASHSDFAMWGPWEFDRAFMRNPIAFWMSREVGHWSPRTQHVETFLRNPGTGGPLSMNHYWGVYVFMERIERGVGRVDLGRLDSKDNAEPDITGGYILKRDRIEPGDTGATVGGHANIVFHYPKDPTTQQYDYMVDYLATAIDSLGPHIGRQEDSPLIDVTSWIDHHILSWYPKNVDAFRLSGFFYKDRGGLLKHGPLWDYDRSMGCAVDPRPVTATGYFNDSDWDGGTRYFEDPGPPGDGGRIGTWYGRLFDDQPPRPGRDSPWNRAYRARWRELREGPLATENIMAQIDAWAEVLREPAARDLGRWNTNFPRGGYMGEVTHLKNWLSRRADWIDEEFGQEFAAPDFSPPGGAVDEGIQVTLSVSEGVIYYTLNGPDPRETGGTPHAEAEVYSGPITVNENTVIRARARHGTDWSVLVEAGYVTDQIDLVVTEIMYNPDSLAGDSFGRSLYEFLEFYNSGNETVNLSGVTLADPFFNFTGTVPSLAPGEYVVVARNVDAFVERYGSDGILLAGAYSGALSNTTDNIVITGPAGETLLDFDYRDSWQRSTDGQGHSLVIRNPGASTSTWGFASSWRASVDIAGSPGREDTARPRRRQGDLNGDGALDIVDVMAVLFNMFEPDTFSAEPCDSDAGNRELQDIDGDSLLTLSDAVRILLFIYRNGDAPWKGTNCVFIEGCPAACN